MLGSVINLQLIGNPINWAVLFLMIAIAYIGAGYIVDSANLPAR